MLQQKLTNLRDFILRYNAYFNTGYDNAVKDDFTGQINNNREIIFPNDLSGNFFYLRLPNDIYPDYSNLYNIADNHRSIGIRYDIILVACVQDAANDKLLENMITTLGNYTCNDDTNLSIKRCIYQPDTIIAQELAKLSTEDLAAAAQRLFEYYGMCCIHFSLTIPFVYQNLNCIQSPCKDC